MNESEPASGIAVVVATRDRPRLLSERALSSVTSQTRAPEHLIVVDDSSPDVRATNREIVEGLQIPGCCVIYLENARTEGASGSWNTALDILTDIATDGDMFVAILDDDDAWRPTYLERCEAAARHRRLNMVAADLRRVESVDQQPTIEEAPEALDADACLVCNPGIQGSNIFARLSVLLAAGGFDEALRSTTDRDLCIRIADLGWVRYGRLSEALVDHFADSDRARLSTRGSAAKLDGLSAFWRKHAGRMRTDQRKAFAARAAAHFDWIAPEQPAFPDCPAADATHRFDLVLGLVASHDRPAELMEFVRQLAECRDAALVGLDVVLFEHATRKCTGPDLLAVAAGALRDAGAGCFCFTRELQHEIRGTVAVCCEAVARSRTGSEVWLAEQKPRAESPQDTGISGVLSWLGAERGGAPSMAPPAAEDAEPLQRWVARERAVTAEHRVRRRYTLGELRVLGSGCESVVFTDGHTVYKCIDHWKRRMPRSQTDFLRSQLGRWANIPGLYVLREVAEDRSWVVLCYDFEESSPYQGGHDDEIVTLINGCSAAGIVCNNVHPKNLVIAASGVKLIDYGSDIRPWSPLGFEHMARRAYLACHHAVNPDLPRLMRNALTDIGSTEFAGYAAFRSRLVDPPLVRGSTHGEKSSSAVAPHPRSSLYVGVITSDPVTLLPLLRGLSMLAKDCGVIRLVTVVLDNACPAAALDHALREARDAGLEVAVACVAQQREDAAEGAFGRLFRERPVGPVGIAAARTMLQRYVGALMEQDPGSFAWILDDDMRVDNRARGYLQWLPSFRDAGVDVLIGSYEGTSPNPPLNGLRVQLVDIFYNLLWLQGLPEGAALPDRSAENTASRARFSDYYYDLSRRHTAHLEMPHWVEPIVEIETVAEARGRLLASALGILTGQPITRALVSPVPADPIVAATDSVNRGGNTFVLNHRALTQTPNTIVRVQGREARRSDMIWAIVNRQYRRMNVKAVAFPVRHLGQVTNSPRLNIEKVQGELVGSGLYGALAEFLSTRPEHTLNFSSWEVEEIQRLSTRHRDRRLRGLCQSIRRIMGLREAIRGVKRDSDLDDLLSHLDDWFTPELFERIRDGVQAHCGRYVEPFLISLRASADDYASTTINIDFIHAQLRAGTGT